MAKQGMKRPEITEKKQKNDAAPVPEIQGKAKHGNKSANPIIAGTHSPSQKVYHGGSHSEEDPITEEDPIPDVYPVIDNDLARDNIENDMTAADLQDL